MPVKIRQKQTKKIGWVDYESYERDIINNDLYETLLIKDVYELYNRISGVELWQTTIDKHRAIEALNKHPDIFRIQYSDKNTFPEKEKKQQVLVSTEEFGRLLHNELQQNETTEARLYNKPYNRFLRFLNKSSVWKTIKNVSGSAWKYSLKLFTAIWKYIVALSLVYLGIGNHLDEVYKFIKSIFIK